MNEKNAKHGQDAEARRILDRGGRESAASSLSVLERTKGHFSASDADAVDPIEVWGTRIGRLLGLAVLIAMFLWLMGSIFGFV
ncbi:MAG: hypothetical protein ACREIP_02930 [Alphaproteobacteria bacterium]